MASVKLKKKYRVGKSYKSQSSSKSISGSKGSGKKKSGKTHPNQKDMILVVRPGLRKMMTVEEFKASDL